MVTYGIKLFRINFLPWNSHLLQILLLAPAILLRTWVMATVMTIQTLKSVPMMEGTVVIQKVLQTIVANASAKSAWKTNLANLLYRHQRQIPPPPQQQQPPPPAMITTKGMDTAMEPTITPTVALMEATAVFRMPTAPTATKSRKAWIPAHVLTLEKIPAKTMVALKEKKEEEVILQIKTFFSCNELLYIFHQLIAMSSL